MKNIIYNFSAGPAMLPKEVLVNVKKDFLNWDNIGTSVIEISHRSQEFSKIIKNTENDLRELLSVPKNYIILFCSGGARGQFSAIPMNFQNSFNITDYVDSGYWSNSAMLEAKKYCTVNHIPVKNNYNGIIKVLPMEKWKLSNESSYVHYCPNETIEGIAIHEEPFFEKKTIIGDFSSSLLSRKININRYSFIYASAQKNLGPSGITVIIMKKNMLQSSQPFTPSILNYKTIFMHQSMFNTPVTFSWYVMSLVLKWMKKKGGVDYFEKNNQKKSKLLYQKIDNSEFYINRIHKKNRSWMNVIFNLYDEKLNEKFLTEAHKYGLKFLKGHKIIGGFRASIYNAMPMSGVKKLIKFMSNFEKKFG
ncbi:3-phosphoserine/phosphohydroxythreonine transaminase [Buchnera aphidicola]|uniref:3-phosphoserine/phosphohydroxythreonine transaminase n=1 Tax=Buchnera aphidicola TaxID=9 RepID=UPI003463EED8